MRVRTSCSYSGLPYQWSATDDDIIEDGVDRYFVGLGSTKEEAIADLERLMREKAEYEEDVQRLRKFRQDWVTTVKE